MTQNEFRALALALPEANEDAHMGHPDFRVGGRIFATLGYPDDAWAMVKLTPGQQAEAIASHPATFRPVKGKWGEGGATNVRLETADADRVRAALGTAWGNLAPPGLRGAAE